MPPQDVKFWAAFEDTVAELYRRLGAKSVKQNVNLAGNQVDILVEEETASGQIIRTAVECKFYKRRLPKTVTLQGATVAQFLKQANEVDRYAIVAYQGFSQDAFLVAHAANIELISFADLESRAIRASHVLYPVPNPKALNYAEIIEIIAKAEEKEQPTSDPDAVFVLMPFAPEMEDTYIYGIRGAAEGQGLKCQRADEIEHSHEIMKEVVDHITRSRFIVADLTLLNANVYYELGWAHALEREPILVAKQGSAVPFDVAHLNLIFYQSIKDLETKLSGRFKHLLNRA